MDTLNAIFTSYSVGDLKPDPVSRELIEQLLSAAVQAPNHYKVRPWRFVVITGAGRERMGEVLSQSFATKFPDAPANTFEKERLKPLCASIIIAIAMDKPSEPKVLEIENTCAATAENLLLAAQAFGLAAKWHTSEDARNPHLKEFLGSSAEQDLIALLYIGYPAGASTSRVRPGFEDSTIGME